MNIKNCMLDTFLIKRNNSRGEIIIFTCAILFLGSGCASMMQRKELSEYNSLYSCGRYTEAAQMELEKKGDEKNDPSTLLQSLQAAAAYRYAKKYAESVSLFDECEDIIKHHNEALLATKIASNVGSVLANDTILSYTGTAYDGIMVNTYKALNFWQMGKTDLARVEFNRALDRQRRAKELFVAEIARQKEELRKKQEEESKAGHDGQKTHVLDYNKNVTNPEIEKILKEKYSDIYEFKKYPDFINPFTTYLAGLFFMAEGDFSKAATILKEAHGMLEDNAIVASDFANTEKILDGHKPDRKYTWVIFENGLGPVKKEFRIDLPLLLATNKVKYTGIALPRLAFRENAFPHLLVRKNGSKPDKTCPLASMDRVVQTEFKKRFKLIVTRNIISALVKTYGQYVAQQKLGDVGGYLTALYQGVNTAADIRIWSALPKEFQVAKIASPEDGTLIIETPDGGGVKVDVPKNSNSLVYVKIPSKGARPVCDVINM